MVGAYLLDPARRTYDLVDIAAQRGLAAAPDEKDDKAARRRPARAATRSRRPTPPPRPAWSSRSRSCQRKSMKEHGLEKLMDEVEMPLVEVLAEMERVGREARRRSASPRSARASRSGSRSSRPTSTSWRAREFTIGSPQQLAEVLFDELGLTKKRRGKTGFSTDARVLGQIRDEHEIVPKIEEWRELTKLKSTYLDALPELIDPDTGRIHTTFNQTATATGRLSSTNPNLQNIPIRSDEGRPIRSCFVAPRGQRLLSADYNQIELRILAHIAGEDALREIFARGEDIHTATAAEVLGADPKKVSPAERSKAKMVNYGIAYGLSAYGLSDRLNIEQEEAAAYIERYFERFPAVKRYINETIAKAREKGYVTHPARPAPADPRAALGPPAGPRPGRAARGQHADPGHLGGHHQDRDGQRAPGAGRVGAGDPPGPPDPRRAPVRGPDRGDGGGGRARGARDVRRLRARPAACGRRRRRPRLARGQVAPRAHRVSAARRSAGDGDSRHAEGPLHPVRHRRGPRRRPSSASSPSTRSGP